MNTPPNDHLLALWLDDELEGEELAQVEAWAIDQPDQLAAREQVREWRKMIGDHLPTSEEPPASEFFNERIQHAIRLSDETAVPASEAEKTSPIALWMPLAACAGMVLAFWLGSIIRPQTSALTEESPAKQASPNLYTPEEGVEAEWIASTDASATVIILNGVNAIPDEVDFTSVALRHTRREIDSTASSETHTPNE